MGTALNELMRIALLLTAMAAVSIVSSMTAYAASRSPGAFGADAASAGRAAILVKIDKTSQTMAVFLGGVEKYEWPVSTGKPGYSTPTGTYTATSMNEIWYSKEWDNAPMPHAVFFMRDGHAIHGSLDVKNLGSPVSHGCVRISPKNAATLYALVKKNGLENTQVVISGDDLGGAYGTVLRPASPDADFFRTIFGVH